MFLMTIVNGKIVIKCCNAFITTFCIENLNQTTVAVFFLQRLQAKIIKIVDVSYGGENGFNQAIELASEALANVKFIQEKKLIGINLLF